MTSIESITLEVADPTAAHRFYTDAFGLDTQIRLRASEAPTTGFRGFTLSLTVSQPADVDSLIDAALDAGVLADGSGSHRLVIGSNAEPFTDPDGFSWETTSRQSGAAARQLDEAR